MAGFIVTNLNYTSEKKCNCGSWIQHWRNFTGSQRTTCAAVPCGNNADVGAHVTIKGKSGHWIVPLCHSHNQSSGQMELDSRITAVSANKNKTCK